MSDWISDAIRRGTLSNADLDDLAAELVRLDREEREMFDGPEWDWPTAAWSHKLRRIQARRGKIEAALKCDADGSQAKGG